MHNDMVGSTNERCHVLCLKSHQDFGPEKVRMDVEEDRLSSLPDDVIHTILSLISLRQAIRTCVLSSRWRFMWTSRPSLSFSSQDLFPEFVSNVMCHRNNELQLSSLELFPSGKVGHECAKRILDYASPHDIQQLTITSNSPLMSVYLGDALEAKPAWGLTRLHLGCFLLSDDNFTGIFSNCPNLKHLSLRRCMVRGGRRDDVLNICHPRLSNLTLDDTYERLDSLKVVAPQLKNLTIIDGNVKQYLISAPGLTSLVIEGHHPLQLFATQRGFPSLEKVDLCFYRPHLEDSPRDLVCLLHQLHNAKYLTLNLEILEVLSSSMEPPISHQPSTPFAYLNILKFSMCCPATVYMEVQLVTEIKNNLEGSFPSAIVTMISSEEIKAMRNIVSAQLLIAELGKLLDECKELGYTNTNAPVVSKWENMMRMYIEETEERVVTGLRRIEALLTGPVSKIPVMQAIVSSVCEEARVVTKNILESTTIKY